MYLELIELLAGAKAKTDAMTQEERQEMLKKQGESYVRAEASWPKPNYKYLNGIKVYESYEDYYND